MKTNLTTLKKIGLMFPTRRMLLAALLVSVSLFLSFPALAQTDSLTVSKVDTVVISKVDSTIAGQDTLSQDAFFYTRESAPAPEAPMYEATPAKDKRLFFTLKTNMLYDVVTALKESHSRRTTARHLYDGAVLPHHGRRLCCRLLQLQVG